MHPPLKAWIVDQSSSHPLSRKAREEENSRCEVTIPLQVIISKVFAMERKEYEGWKMIFLV
jgi:hypothetical protein